MKRRNRLLILSSVFLVVFLVAAKLFLDSIYRLPILMYHSVDYTSDRKNKITVSPDAFARQMKYLHDNKYNVVTLEKAVSYISQKKRPPAKTVAITIDDGYENNFQYAYPILKRYNTPATIFVITNMIGSDRFLDWSEIKEMSDSGLIDIESHTLSHPWLTGLSDAILKKQIVESKAILEKRLGKKVSYLCYPMGVFDERVKSAAKEAGYAAAFATKPTRLTPVYDLYEIKRVRISPSANNMFVFAIKLSGYHAFFRIMHNDYKNIPSVKWKPKKS